MIRMKIFQLYWFIIISFAKKRDIEELHCCVGPSYQTLIWYKDGKEFPWDINEGKTRNTILYSNNQSLIIMDVKSEDSGRFSCVAMSETEEQIVHTTRLTSFPPPVFAHPPIWNNPPEDLKIKKGEKAELQCSVTVGQQYNSMQPVYAAWLRFGRELENGPRIKISRQWTDDDIVLHLSLTISNIDDGDMGEYSCKVKNEYGDLEKKITLSVDDFEEKHNLDAVKREMKSIVRKQLKLFSLISRYSNKHQEAVNDYLKNAAEKDWI